MRFLQRLAPIAGLSIVLAACTGQATTAPTAAPTKAATPAASATAATTPAPTSACTPSTAGADAPTVKLATARGLPNLPTWNMVNVGPKYGFKAEMVVAFTYADQQRVVAAGDADVATTGVNMPAVALANNVQNLKVIAGQHWGGQNLVIRTGVTVNSWKDLEGKNIGLAPGTWSRVLFLITAKQKGVDLNKVTQTNLSDGATALQALKRGELDGIVLFSPTVDQAVVEGTGYYPKGVDIGDADIMGDANGAIYANAAFLQKSALARNYVCAFVDSLTQMATDQEAFVKLGVQVTGVSEAIIREAYKHMRFSYNIPRAAIIEAAKLGPEFGYAKENYSSTVTQMLDYSLLQAATGKSVDSLSQPPAK